ncbi:hypothetical protein diail_5238 [Diaporthe ilicicola]|nr:hypothetical protein diail_5238 [Diaporthe ilicicola]
MPPRGPPSVVTVFGLGHRPGRLDRFLDQVDMGINMGGLVRVDREKLEEERTEQQLFLHGLNHKLDTAKLNFYDFMTEHEDLENDLKELEGYYTRQAKLIEDAYAQRDISTAIGLELANKNLRVEMSICARELNQKSTALKEIRAEISSSEHEIVRAEVRLQMVEAQLRPVTIMADLAVKLEEKPGATTKILGEDQDVMERLEELRLNLKDSDGKFLKAIDHYKVWNAAREEVDT